MHPMAMTHKEANQRAAFGGHLVVYIAVVLFLLVVAGWTAGVTVALAWGIGIAAHGYFGIAAPALKAAWTETPQVERTKVLPAARRTDDVRLETLAASVAHEIRNPVAAVKSLVQQIGEAPEHDDNAEYARVALEELDRVERSVAHLLRYAREESFKPADVRLDQVVAAALATFDGRLDGIHVERELEPVVVHADGEQLRRVFINLVGNAVDAMSDDETPAATLTIACGRNLAGDEAWVRVNDTGPGMSPGQLERVFEPFQTSKARGTGLGLAIVRKVVAAHGGTIDVSSEPGIGTEFTVRLPRKVPAA